MDDSQELLAANASYYRAFLNGDADAMAGLWADSNVSCIHPGWPPLIGRDVVLQSYRAILRAPGRDPIEFHEARPLIVGEDGRVICVETIGGATLAVTNLFRRVDGAWRMIHHQASPIAMPESEPATPRVLN
jgi:hypothetical protein